MAETAAPPPPPSSGDPDAHGQAALLLVESLIHGLIENGTLSINRAIEIATCAAEVKEAIVDEASESSVTAQRSLQMIANIIASLELDRSTSATVLDRTEGDAAGR